MNYTINEVDEDAQHVVVTWTDAAGRVHDHERIAGLFNTAVDIPNPAFVSPFVANPDYRPPEILNPRITDPQFNHATEPLLVPNPDYDPAVPAVVPNEAHDPANPLHSLHRTVAVYTTPESVTAELEAFMARFNSDLVPPQQDAAPSPVHLIRIRSSLQGLVRPTDHAR